MRNFGDAMMSLLGNFLKKLVIELNEIKNHPECQALPLDLVGLKQ